MYDIILTRFLRYSDIVKKVWYHVWYHKIIMISSIISYFWQYHTRFLRYFLWYCLRYHIHIIQNVLWYRNVMILLMILVMIWHDFTPWYHIIAIWYHGFHDMFAYIMAPARRDGAGWGRQGPGAPPPPASPSPTCCGRVFSWTATVLIPRMDLLHRLLRA